MKNWFKNILIPSGEKTTVVAYKSWIVRWQSANFDGSSLIYTKYESEIFPSEEDANKFAESLRDARILLKDKHFNVKIEANQSKFSTLTQ